MIGRRCKCSNVLSRPVLIARDLLSKPKTFLDSYFSQVIYCGGYSGEDPPLPIPNREVKLTSADGTATPSGRVGSCRFSESPMIEISSGFLFFYFFFIFVHNKILTTNFQQYEKEFHTFPTEPTHDRLLELHEQKTFSSIFSAHYLHFLGCAKSALFLSVYV